MIRYFPIYNVSQILRDVNSFFDSREFFEERGNIFYKKDNSVKEEDMENVVTAHGAFRAADTDELQLPEPLQAEITAVYA